MSQQSENKVIEKLPFYGGIKGIALEHKQRYGVYDMKVKHFHPEYEIFYLIEGGRTFFYDNRNHVAQEGDLILLDSNLIHMTRSIGTNDQGHNRIILYITPDMMKHFDHMMPNLHLIHFFHEHYGIYHLNEIQKKRLKALYDLFKEEITGKDLYYDEAIRLASAHFLLYLVRDFINEHALEPDNRNGNQRIYAIADYLSEHYAEDITLDDLSRKFYLSTYHISRTFHEVTGYKIREYLNIMRVREAKSLLEETDLSIEEVSTRTGFHSSSHFEKIFRSYMNMSPLKYRQQKDVYVSGIMPVVDHLTDPWIDL
jgi:AraC-like DNA-binding protein